MKPEASPSQDHTPKTTIPPPAYITIDSSGSEEAYDLEAYPSQYDEERIQHIYIPPQSTVTVTVSEPERRRRESFPLPHISTKPPCPVPSNHLAHEDTGRYAPLASMIFGIVLMIIVGGLIAMVIVAIVLEAKNVSKSS
ncbi:hypothetical protein BO86DRAFT_398283 [Aspergillus japonicus CBS 114.51]|uniref:Uncharacterized protein n=1 Tax=Aspergillus japonicus CBS 114.51 TaxID=1448312 RepID=A0A8T8X5L3_ASPJA|nr:hypothetical protein BO86DRAFT_398283 [Aspergillus japonicus CBS 114.51]RAH83250.1 hypothetical protein BO86DRAFT_398283 [Aspergillus japonicus CBS 114.51]